MKEVYLPISKNRIRKIGDKVRHDKELSSADHEILRQWRALHIPVLKSWRTILERHIRQSKVGDKVELAQRYKKYSTIISKLKRYSTNLSNLNDIAGCRLIFNDMRELQSFRDSLHKKKNLPHTRIQKTKYNYLNTPKESGYRGIHDVYIFNNPKSQSNGLRVEIQYRTRIQHIWATALESLDMLKGGDYIKFNTLRENINNKDTEKKEALKYFQLSSEILARTQEKTTSCLPEKSNSDLLFEYAISNFKTSVLKKLLLCETAVSIIDKDLARNSKAFILSFTLNGDKGKVEVIPYTDEATAIADYSMIERENVFSDSVLIKVNDYKSIKKLYPNYFTETDNFSKKIKSSSQKLLKEINKEKQGFNIKEQLKRLIIKLLLNTQEIVSGFHENNTKNKPRKYKTK